MTGTNQHAGHEGKVQLTISEATISVVDNGIGLDTAQPGLDGYGIGLVLVQDICKKYGWVFSLENNPTSGCTATVRIKSG